MQPLELAAQPPSSQSNRTVTVWSNEAVADDIEPLALGGEDSPWARDVPIAPPPPLPAAWSEAPAARPPNPIEPSASASAPVPVFEPPMLGAEAEPERDVTAGPSPTSPGRRAALALGLAGLLAAAAVGSQFVGGDDGGVATEGTTPESTWVVVSGSIVEPIPTTERARPRPASTIGNTLPEPAPVWTMAKIDVSPRIQALTTPIQLVAVTSRGVLHVIDLPAGVVQSFDTDRSGINSVIELGPHGVVLGAYDRNDVSLFRVGEPPISVEIGQDGTNQIINEPGTDDFILVPNQWNPVSPEVLRLTADGVLTNVVGGPLVEFNPWELQFLDATGELIVNDTGGVYTVGVTGAATRVSTGDLVIVGANHYIVRECTETLECSYVRVDQTTGERVPVKLDAFDQLREYVDIQSSSLSPDGTALTYFRWSPDDQGRPSRRLSDLATGVEIEVSSSDQYGSAPAWAADSSGLFVVAGGSLSFFDRATGELIPIAPDSKIDGIVTLGVRPASD